MQSPTRHLATDGKVSEAFHQNNQKGSTASANSTGDLGGGPNASISSFGLYVRWSVKARTSYPMSPAKLAALLKDVFGQKEVCFITDDLLRIHENGSKSGYTVLGAKPTAEQHVAQPRAVDGSACLVSILKVDGQPWRPWTKGSEPEAKRQRTHESPSPSPIAPSTPGPVYPPPAYTYNGAPAACPYYYASYQPPTTAYLMLPPPPSNPSPGSTYPPPPPRSDHPL